MSDAGDVKSSSVLGLTAVGIATTELFAQVAAIVLQRMGKANLSTSFGWLIFDYGFLLDLAATLLAALPAPPG